MAQTNLPEWSADKMIYEVNVRQYTPEGTFDAFSEHLPRLHDMGVGILWLMPINPIGVENRKGSLGSYYAVKDYKAVNPEYGNIKDFKKLVDAIHKQGMYVIVDWVANHTAWDNVWMKEHPDFYTRGKDGNVVPPVEDWADVADLNYDNMELRKAMINAMQYWVEEADIDGFRCDVALMVPDDFWKDATTQLRSIKPGLFFLAEAEGPNFIEDGFNMVYGWNRHHAMNMIAQGKAKPAMLDSLVRSDIAKYPADGLLMNFTSNHDENTWNGTEFERMGDANKCMAVAAATLPGMLLEYTGQEVAMHKRLRFFDKDTVSWVDDKNYTQFWTGLIRMKENNPALWNGTAGGDYTRIDAGNDNIYCFTRIRGDSKVLVIMNMSAATHAMELSGYKGKWRIAYTGEKAKIKKTLKAELGPWEYRVYAQ